MSLHCTWRDMMREAGQRLADAGVPNAPRDARLLLAHALGLEPADVLVRELDAIDPVQLTAFEQAVQRRLAGEPVSRIRGWREFYGRRFRITPDVLDPRPETELLVEEGLKRLPKAGQGIARVLDLGVGSGCILLSILAERPDAAGVGLDISPAALAVARDNARALGVSDRVSFIEGGWSDSGPPLPRLRGRGAGVGGLDWPDDGSRESADRVGFDWETLPAFDLVLSNPPYIAESELPSLAPDVRLYDPRIALVGVRLHPEEARSAVSKDDPLAAHRAILALAPALLKPGASIGLEVGQGQHDAVAALMSAVGLAHIAILPDLAGIPRAVFGRRS
jgi:release factor glutamine methyltransferase